MKINVPELENRTAPDLKPMTTERFIKELVYPWSAWLDKRGLLILSYQDEEKASYLPGDDHWDFRSTHFKYSIDISLMQKMLALAKYERAGRQYVLVNGKAKIGRGGEKYWNVFILGADGLGTTIAFEDELQEYTYSKEELERTVDRYPLELWHAIGSLAIPLDELLTEED